MDEFLGTIGLLGVITFTIPLIISVFRKTPKQRWVIGILSSALCIVIAFTLSYKNISDRAIEELKREKSQVETLEKDVELLESRLSIMSEESVENMLNLFSKHLGGDVLVQNKILMFSIPLDEGGTRLEKFQNAFAIEDDIENYKRVMDISYLAWGIKHFVFTKKDSNNDTIVEFYFDNERGELEFNVGATYVDVFYSLEGLE
jgi:hypothetical protein